MKRCSMNILYIVALFLCIPQIAFAITSRTKNDPYPLFTTAYPYNLLTVPVKHELKGCVDDCCTTPDHVFVSITPFHQKASNGRNFTGQRVLLGDLEGRWSMLSMLYGPVPAGETLVGKKLGEAKVDLFGYVPAVDSNPNAVVPQENVITDSGDRIGFFAVPLKYRKNGIRFEVQVQPICDFGFTMQAGFADIQQTYTHFINLTDTVTTIGPFTQGVLDAIQNLLMTSSMAQAIFNEQGLDICNFRHHGPEDLRFALWWRHIFEVNRDRDPCEWPQFLFTPFVVFEASVPTGKVQDRRKAFSLPFGNDGHSSIAFTGGVYLDFYETVEIGFYGGITGFNRRTIANFRLPTHFTQSGVFPWSTTVNIKPGSNGNFGVLFHAYRFVDKLSFHGTYDFIHHNEDSIQLVTPDPAFLPQQQECLSKWTSQMLSTALNYEISPNFTLGFLVQWPINQRNSYRATTVMASLQGYF